MIIQGFVLGCPCLTAGEHVGDKVERLHSMRLAMLSKHDFPHSVNLGRVRLEPSSLHWQPSG